MTNDEIKKYLNVCGYLPDDTISVVWKARSGKLGWTHVPVSEAHKPIVGHQLVDCWISANPMRTPADPQESRGTSDDVYAVRALWADLDVGPGKMPSYPKAREVIDIVSRLIKAQPVAMIASGHGLQPRWRLEGTGLVGLDAEAEVRESAADLLERFNRLVQIVAERVGGKADSVFDLPRIIRAPGTRNCKDTQTGIEVKVRFVSDDVVALPNLQWALDSELPPTSPPPAPTPKAENVDSARGNRYAKAIYESIRAELLSIKTWPVGKTDDRGRGWEKIQADAAYRLAELAKADWNSLTLAQAEKAFGAWAPTGGDWTVRDVAKKWKSQAKRAEPALPPAAVDDPLSPGYQGADASPHSGAPDAGGGPGGTPEALGASTDPGVGHSGAPDAGGEGRGSGATGEGRDAQAGPSAADGRRNPADPGAGDPVAGGAADVRAVAAPVHDWRKFEWNERGNADRIIHLWGSTLRWSPGLDLWLRYVDGAWRENPIGGEQAALQMLDRLNELETKKYSSVEYPKSRGKVSTQRLDFQEWIDSQKTAARIKAAAQMVKFTGELDTAVIEFDNDPMLLNAVNGVIELRTGVLLGHDPALMLRRQIPVSYDPDAKAPMWEAYLQRVMPHDDQREYLQRIVGYSITGRTDEQAMFLHHGVTHNGKGVFLQVLEAMLGDFSRVIPATTLLTKKSEQHPTDVKGLEGRRMLQLDEVAEGARLDEALIKRLTGQTTVTARGMGQDFSDFRIKGKIHMVVNHLPHMGDDPATKRRVKLVNWGVTIPVEERDSLLAERIIAQELPGVLAWAVRGALEWGNQGLAIPPELELAAAEYFASEDEFGEWVDEELVIGADAFVPSREVYRRYRQHCEGMGSKPMSHVAFGRKLSARGAKQVRTMSLRGWAVAFRSSFEASPDPLA